ncbi:MAG: LPS export ABC transporter periplasmic protein LptC [Bacteroidales bacterium]|nr:LPS export ABC transporter periplasmic protein LptC [Bacteroidales bacterium]
MNSYQKRRWSIYLRFHVVLILLLCLFYGCVDQTDIDKAHKYNESRDTLPAEIIYNFHMNYSENGIIKIDITGREVINRAHKKEMEFPQGFEAVFYNADMSIKSRLSAGYGINYEEKKVMMATKNVEIINYESNEKLNTEELTWDQNTAKIFTDRFVKITTETDVIYGDGGFESDETFENWIIKKPTGNFVVEEE